MWLLPFQIVKSEFKIRRIWLLKTLWTSNKFRERANLDVSELPNPYQVIVISIFSCVWIRGVCVSTWRRLESTTVWNQRWWYICWLISRSIQYLCMPTWNLKTTNLSCLKSKNFVKKTEIWIAFPNSKLKQIMCGKLLKERWATTKIVKIWA